MQKIASYIIDLMKCEQKPILTCFSCAIFIFALMNFLLAHKLARRGRHKQHQDVIVSKNIFRASIAWACFCLIVIWLPFEWSKILSRIILIIELLFPIALPILNIRHHYDPSVLLFISSTFYLLITSNLGMADPLWGKIFILLNILLFFLFIFAYIPILIFDFMKNIKNKRKNNNKRLALFAFRISKIGAVASIVLSYTIIVYSNGFFSENLEKVFNFIAEAVIVPIVFALFLDIKNILGPGN